MIEPCLVSLTSYFTFLNVASENGIIASLYLSSPERATYFSRQLKLHLDGLHRSVVDEFGDEM